VQIVAVIMDQGTTLRNQCGISLDIKRKTTINQMAWLISRPQIQKGLSPDHKSRRAQLCPGHKKNKEIYSTRENQIPFTIMRFCLYCGKKVNI
jgi:hypothetical protein